MQICQKYILLYVVVTVFWFVFVVRLRSIFCAFSSIWFQIDAIWIYWNCHHSFDWFGILLRKILGSFPSLSLCLSHTHKKILFEYLHIWTLFIQSIYMYVFVSGDVTNINAKRNKYGFLIRGVYMMVATILFLENNFQLRF